MIFTAETVVTTQGQTENYAKLNVFAKVVSMMEEGKTDGNRKVPVAYTYHRYWVDRAAAEEFLEFVRADAVAAGVEVVEATINDINPTEDPYKNEVFYAVGEIPNLVNN